MRLTLKAPLQLVDLAGASLRRMGADARITTGDYGVAQRWALALWRYRPRPDGLYWRSRFDTTRFAVALFDHVAPVVDATIVGGWDERAQAPLLAAILDAYDLALL